MQKEDWKIIIEGYKQSLPWILLVWVLTIYYLEGNLVMTTEHIFSIVVGIVPSVITGIVTWTVSRKSQLNKNTEAINELTKRIGASEDKTLKAELGDQYNNVIDGMGTKQGGGTSLTKQHETMQTVILQSYEEIKSRYKKEDEQYRKFSDEQKNISDSLLYASKGYNDVIEQKNRLEESYNQLLKDYQDLKLAHSELKMKAQYDISENEKLTRENQNLTETIRILKAESQKPTRQRKR